MKIRTRCRGVSRSQLKTKTELQQKTKTVGPRLIVIVCVCVFACVHVCILFWYDDIIQDRLTQRDASLQSARRTAWPSLSVFVTFMSVPRHREWHLGVKVTPSRLLSCRKTQQRRRTDLLGNRYSLVIKKKSKALYGVKPRRAVLHF